MQDWLADVQRAQEGDLAAFDRVVKRFEGMAVAYAYSILGDFQLAEDAAQEAFIQAYCDLHTLQRSCAFPAWLRRLIFKHCDRQLRRKRVPMLPLDATLDVPDRGNTPLEALQQKETHEAVLGAINSLPDPVRAVTVLFYISGYSMTEVGDFLELPVSTVKNRLHAARTQLRERMMSMAEETIKQHAPGDAFSARVKKVLENIERIHWDTTAVICFAGAVAATMRYLGEPVSNDYVMGISGGAFKLFWHPEWAGDNCDLLIYGEEPIRRTFAALGYAYQFIPFPETIPAEQREQCRKQIIASIDAGKPVLAQGIVGPPECSVIAGYDKNGAVLYGRSYFQEESDESGYFRVENWEENCYSLIFIGEKTGAPAPRQVLKDSLEWAIHLAWLPEFEKPALVDNTTRARETLGSAEKDIAVCDSMPAQTSTLHHNGLKAYDSIIEALLRDADYPDDIEVLRYRAMALGNDGINLLPWKRWAAAGFLEEMLAQQLPGADSLRQAARLYREEKELLVQKAGPLTPYSGFPAERILPLRNRARREAIASCMRQAKQLEEQAVACLERACAELSE